MHNYTSLNETNDPEEQQGIFYHLAEPTRPKWNHIKELDSFFSRMYKYHQKHGFTCMLLQELSDLQQYIFVVVITTYLVHGIDYQALFNNYDHPREKKVTLADVILSPGDCISYFTFLTWLLLVLALIVWVFKLLVKLKQIFGYWDIKQFYNTALGINDNNLDNLTWHEVQSRIKTVQLEQQMCIHKNELTELDIYHRILRQENYFVAMVNKKLLPPRNELPFTGDVVYWTKSLRLNFQFLFFWSPWAAFESPWHLREEYKRANHRDELAKQLGKKIRYLAIINFALSPVIFIWQCLHLFFNYCEIIRREPGTIGIRLWSLYGKLYLRHFNELEHELHARLTRAYRPATKYMAAFSSPIVTVISRQINFFCAALLAVLIALTVFDEDVIAVEHVITIMTGLGAAIAICNSIIPDETMVWCPETLLESVVRHTHYSPTNWRGYAHTNAVRAEFQQLFQYRVVALFEELLSPVITPFLLYFWVYRRRYEFVDFFRNFTVSVVGVGDVCSFAQMDVKKHGNADWNGIPETPRADTFDENQQAEDGKIELSLIHFVNTNPTWEPPEKAKEFITNLEGETSEFRRDEPFFASLQDRFESSSQNFSDIHTQRSLAAIPRRDDFRLIRQSVWMSEGPIDSLGPLNMQASCMALHDRYHRRRGCRPGRSYKETTHLLISEP